MLRLLLLGCLSALLTLAAGCNSNSPGEHAQPSVNAPADTAKLQTRLDAILEYTLNQRRLNTKDQSAWQIVHGALVYGDDYQIEDEGKQVVALEYLLGGGQLNGWNLRPGDRGVVAVLEAGSKTGQGHPDQWLGYLSQIGLATDREVMVSGKKYTVADLIEQAQWDLKQGQEATWTLMALATYLPLDAKWTSKDGAEWTLEKIVAMEAAADLSTSACGGSHRLYGLSVALNRYLAEGNKLVEVAKGAQPDGWQNADAQIKFGIKKAREYQQTDGSFSTNYFSRPAYNPDIIERIGATGHTLEFLTLSLNDEQLKEPWFTRAAASLVNMLEKTRDADVECGKLYHAAHGLVLYRQRMFGPRASYAVSGKN